MNAWMVCAEELGCLPVHAETRGKARFMSSDLADYWEEYLGLSVRRMPEFDGRSLDCAELEMISLGYYGWGECVHCGVEIQRPDSRGDPPTDSAGYRAIQWGCLVHCWRCYAAEMGICGPWVCSIYLGEREYE